MNNIKKGKGKGAKMVMSIGEKKKISTITEFRCIDMFYVPKICGKPISFVISLYKINSV